MAMNPDVPSDANHFGHARQRQAARDAGDRSPERAGHAGGVQDSQQEDRRAVSTLVIEQVAQQAEQEAGHRPQPDSARAEMVDAKALKKSHRQAADHADADDQPHVPLVAAQVQHEIGIPIEQRDRLPSSAVFETYVHQKARP